MCFEELRRMLQSKKEVWEMSIVCFNSIAEETNKNIKRQLLEHIQSKKIKVKLNDIKFENIEKIDPYQTIQNKDELLQFITSSYNKVFLNMTMGDEYLYHVTNGIKIQSKIIERNKPIASDIDFKNILNSDISLLKQYDILTSRLAVIVYRIANLKPYASTTECGRYFREKVGSKSKAFSFNQYKAWGSRYAFRAYDLNVNDIKLEIQKEIAKKLINLKIKKLDKKKISEVTNLPIDYIDKLYLY